MQTNCAMYSRSEIERCFPSFHPMPSTRTICFLISPTCSQLTHLHADKRIREQEGFNMLPNRRAAKRWEIHGQIRAYGNFPKESIPFVYSHTIPTKPRGLAVIEADGTTFGRVPDAFVIIIFFIGDDIYSNKHTTTYCR